MASGRVIGCQGLTCLVIVFAAANVVNGYIATFEDLSLGPESYWNGSDGSGGFTSGSAHFNNNYNAQWGAWEGFSYSNITDTVTGGFAGLYNAITGQGEGNSANYAIGYVGLGEPPVITLDSAGVVRGLYVTNNNYAYYSMLQGDIFAKKFGGESGGDPDWFLLTITGKDSGGNVGGAVEFYLADYRFSDNSEDNIVNTWRYVDLASLGVVKNLEFSLSSSDVGQWGMNTPACFAVDTIVPEPGTIVLIGTGVLILPRRKRRQRGL